MSIHGEVDCYELNEDLLQLKYTRAKITEPNTPLNDANHVGAF